MCTASILSPSVSTSDIIIKRSLYQNDSLELPAADARFDRCLNSSDTPNSAYSDFLHEVGHALGIGGGQSMTEYLKGHPAINDSVMNYESDEPGCAPNPFDLMAIYALYQSR